MSKLKALLIIIIFLLVGCSLSRKSNHLVVKDANGIVRINLFELKNQNAHFFTYENGRKINFVVISNHGEIWSVFDACRECYRSKLGYRHEGDSIICNDCSNRFSFESIKRGLGGCIPVKLNSSVEGEFLVIKFKDLLEGERYF